ncbi:MAG: hypothetical protein M1160_02555 [Candidatus Marsarchaeota archaeon]|nr:hypothetical protein [Candidatus Marsarchaeota archaeon]
MWCFRERARILKLLEDVSGGRMFYVNLRLGGFNKNPPADFADRCHALADYLEQRIAEYPDMLDSNSVFMERTKGVGVLKKDDAIAAGVSGPVLRASGVEEDARKSHPYYVYDKMKFRAPVKTNGDCYDRYRVRYEEMLESISIIRQAVDMMPSGDAKGMPIRLIGPIAKPDTVIMQEEMPRGEGVIYMVPDKQRPYRISLRSPAFINLSVLPKISEGYRFADLFSIVGSLDVIFAEIDR